MKVRNLAFCGVMASILGVGAAYATDATVIASKAYVDARDNLKENVANKETATYANSTNKTSTTVYPSMATLTDAYTTLNNNITTNVTNNTYSSDFASTTSGATNITVAGVATEDEGKLVKAGNVENSFQAVHDAIANMESAASPTATTNQSTAVTAVTQSDGKITVSAGTLSASAIDSSAKTGGNILGTAAADNGNLVEVGGVKSTVLTQGTFGKAWNEEFAANAENITPNMFQATTNTTTNASAKPDSYVPTVAAVEKRVRLAESNAQSNTVVDNWTSADGDTTHAPSRNVVYDSINVASNGNVISAGTGVNTNLTALDTKIGNTTMGTSDTTLTGAIAEVKNATDGKAAKGSVSSASTDFNIVTYSADGTVNSGKALTQTGLNNINQATNTGTTCSASNPCVLTYTGTDYKWTNMDTDSLSAVADGTNS